MSRPLSGFLDDIDLDEVLRVITLSRRSGLLDVDAAEGRAELHFIAGRLVRARLHDTVETMSALLARHGVIDVEDLSGGVYGETVEALVERAGRRANKSQLLVRADDLIAEQLQDLVFRVLAFRSGSFTFRVTNDTQVPLRYAGDTALTLPSGLDGEELRRDARQRHKERGGNTAGARSSTVPSTSSLGRERGSAAEIVIVDDDPAFLATISQTLGDASVPHLTISHLTQATSARTADRLLVALDEGAQAIVVDLVMPRQNGRGILGGLELMRIAHKAGAADRTFLVIDDAHDDACAIAKGLGITTLRRPHSESELADFINPILQKANRPPLPVVGFDLAKELSRELKDDQLRAEWLPGHHNASDDSVKNLDTLKALLGELNSPSFEEEIPLLLLRFASAFFVRGALFSVDRDKNTLRGLGGFGVGDVNADRDPGRLVRNISIPLAADTVFARAVAERCGVRQPFWESEWNTRFIVQFGGHRPREVYCAPLISPRGLEGVLYADNGTEPRPFPDIALLEIFIQQASAALERATLARELHALRTSQIPHTVGAEP